MLIDSHCHLDFYKDEERPGLLARARDAGVGEMVTIGTRLSLAAKQIALAEASADVWCTVGTHPHHAAEEEMPEEQAIAALAEHPKVIAIGEAGLDYFYDRSPRDVQAEVFSRQIRAARRAGVPICIHTRDADDDTFAILKDEQDQGGEFDFLLHCFSSGRALAEQAVAIGGYVSFSGILTFPKSHELKAIAADLPAERLLVETDAPYLAPVPFRGKRNEPALVAHTARVLAELRGMSPEDLGDLTTRNFRRLFRKAA
ncbi:MAG: TatD family hydrolase [Rhodospirillales bacterium]